MRRLAHWFVLTSLAPFLLDAQQPQPRVVDLVEQVRPAVVQIGVHFTAPEFLTDAQKAGLSENERSCFSFHYCIAGTGFFVNNQGDIVSAAHVALAVKGLAAKLQILGVTSNLYVGVNQPNMENSQVTISSGTESFPIESVAIDLAHDLALFHPSINPFQNRHDYIVGLSEELRHPPMTFVHLGVKRPRDAEDVFACGFPFGTPGMVTNFGTIGSAWKSENLITAKANGVGETVDVYQADLRINPGNSGGPVFRDSDQAVIGVVVESRGTLDTVVPAKYVSKFLSDHKVVFSTLDSNMPASK